MIVGSVLVLLLLVVLDVEADWHRHVALQLLDPLYDLELSRRVENVTSSSQQKLQMLCDIPSSKINSLDSIVDGETFEDWTAVADSITAIQDDTRCLTTSVETEDSLLLEEDLWRSEFLEKDISGLDTIAVRIQWWFSQKNRMFLGRDLKLIEDMPPKLLHIIPVLDNSVLNWIVKFQDSPVFVLNQQYTVRKKYAKTVLTAASPMKVSCSF